MNASPDAGAAVAAGNSYTAAVQTEGGDPVASTERGDSQLANDIRTNFAGAIEDSLPTETFVQRSAGPDGQGAEISGLKAVSLDQAVNLAGEAAYQKALEIGAQIGLDSADAQDIAMTAKLQAQHTASSRAGAEQEKELTTAEKSSDEKIKKHTEELELEKQKIQETNEADGSTLDSSPLTAEERARLAGAIAALAVETEFAERESIASALTNPEADRSSLDLFASQYQPDVEDIFATGFAIAREAIESSAEEQAQQEVEKQRHIAEARQAKAALIARNPDLADEVAAVPNSAMSVFEQLLEIASEGQALDREVKRARQRAGNPAEMASQLSLSA